MKILCAFSFNKNIKKMSNFDTFPIELYIKVWYNLIELKGGNRSDSKRKEQ